jgi:hypothetical protein
LFLMLSCGCSRRRLLRFCRPHRGFTLFKRTQRSRELQLRARRTLLRLCSPLTDILKLRLQGCMLGDGPLPLGMHFRGHLRCAFPGTQCALHFLAAPLLSCELRAQRCDDRNVLVNARHVATIPGHAQRAMRFISLRLCGSQAICLRCRSCARCIEFELQGLDSGGNGPICAPFRIKLLFKFRHCSSTALLLLGHHLLDVAIVTRSLRNGVLHLSCLHPALMRLSLSSIRTRTQR